MLSLMPVALLILAALVIQVIGRVTTRAGSTWFLASIIGFITWLSMILIGILLPPVVEIKNWLPQPYLFASLSFQFTRETWIFGFLLVSLLQAVIFFNSRYLETPNYLNKITGAMILTAFGLLAVLSRSPLAFVLTWSLMDLAEFGVLTATQGNVRQNRSNLTAVLFRELGLILLVLLISISTEQTLQSNSLELLSGWLLFLVILLRMGILPIIQDQTDDSHIRRGFLTLLRTLPLITVFSFITILPGSVLPERLMHLLLITSVISALYGSVLWFASKDELTARPYWFFTFGSLAIAAFLTAGVEGLTGLAVAAVSTGTGLFLYSPRFQSKYVYVPILLIGMLAFPFTPTATLTNLINSGSFSLHQVLIVLIYVLMLTGVVKHGFRKDDTQDLAEPWKRVFHNVSLYFIGLSPWIIPVTMFQMFNLKFNLWLSTSIILLTVIFSGLFFILNKRQFTWKSPISRIWTGVVKGFNIIDQIFRLNWLAKVFSSLSFIISKTAQLLIRVQEGDGGILWSFLFLVLLISLLITRQAP